MVVAKTDEKEKKVRQGDRLSFSPVFLVIIAFIFIAGEPYASQQ